MSVLVDADTRVLVQGLGGAGASTSTARSPTAPRWSPRPTPSAPATSRFEGEVDPSGVPGRSGRYRVELPIFATVRDAVAETGADASVIFVPPPFAADAIMEAADADLALVVVITEGIPIQDMVTVKRYLRGQAHAPGGPELPRRHHPARVPHRHHAWLHPPRWPRRRRQPLGDAHLRGREAAERQRAGADTAIGIGGDPVHGTSFVDALRLFQQDPATEAILMIGEIGGAAEEEAAAFIRTDVDKPVAAFVAGTTAPPGKRMGHAGAIISGGSGTAAEKIAALRGAGAVVASTPSDMGDAVLEAMRRAGGS
jgi:succinyl-CoA synthetase alpha subunit